MVDWPHLFPQFQHQNVLFSCKKLPATFDVTWMMGQPLENRAEEATMGQSLSPIGVTIGCLKTV